MSPTAPVRLPSDSPPSFGRLEAMSYLCPILYILYMGNKTTDLIWKIIIAIISAILGVLTGAADTVHSALNNLG